MVLLSQGVSTITKREIGLILMGLREKAGKSREEVAELLGKSVKTVGHWETGYAQPDANTLFLLCTIYDADLNDSFGFSSGQKNSPNMTEFAPEEEYPDAGPLRSTLLHNFDQLNQEGRERLVETSDDMVSSRKYIKSNSDKLGNEKYA